MDIAAKRVYWVDPKVDRVESIDYDGNDRRIVSQGMNNVNYFSIFGKYSYEGRYNYKI